MLQKEFELQEGSQKIKKFGRLTELCNISTILMHYQCVFVTSHFKKPVIRFHQILEIPEVAGETHVTTQRLLSLFLFIIIVWREKDNILIYLNCLCHNIWLCVRYNMKKLFLEVMYCN